MYLLTVKQVDKKQQSWYVTKTITKIETKNTVRNSMATKHDIKVINIKIKKSVIIFNFFKENPINRFLFHH